MKAIVMTGEPGQASLVTDRPLPQLRLGCVLVDVKAVALNPTDWKHLDQMNIKNLLSGCDYAGVVAATGTGYSKKWKVGDRICGLVHGGNKLQAEDGAFAEKAVVKADIAMRIPEYMSFEEAATLGVGITTCGQGLFQQIGLSWPNQPSTKGEFVLIYGGSSATGTIAVQLAKLAGYTPITTCSPRNFDWLKSLGAAAAFDYNDPACAQKIRECTNDNLKYIFDTIDTPRGVEICTEVISPGGAYGTILHSQVLVKNVKNTTSVAYTATGETAVWGRAKEENMKDLEFMKSFIEILEPFVQQGCLKPHPQKLAGGLEDILDGYDLLRQEKLHGQKLVYQVSR